MNVEVISIGDELLIGQTINTNASWIGEKLLNIGIHLNWVTAVGDDAFNLTRALKVAESRSDVILMTGGLGPTHDDITKKVVTEYYDAKLVLNKEVLKQVKERFRKRKIKMARVNEDQALVPDNALVIFNDSGTAPGMLFRRNGKSIYVMPGVPMEMKSMMNRVILPQLKSELGDSEILIKVLCTTGIPESTLFEKIGDINQIEKYARLAFLPNLQGVKILIMVKESSREKAASLLQKAEQMVRKNVERYIYSDEQVQLEEAVAEMLLKNRQTLAVAESCTGGLLANTFTNISGSSGFFERGVVTYSNQSKIDILGVSEDVLKKHGAVSESVAKAMAEGIRITSGATFGLSTTGIAGPTGGTEEKPVGTVYIGFSDKNKTFAKRFNFANNRLGNKERSVAAALNILRAQILNKE